MRAKSYLGIEIGNACIKLSEISKDKQLVRFLADSLPENMVQNGLVVSWDAMADVLRSLIKQHGFSSKNAAIALPDSALYMRRINLPIMNAAQLMTNLPYEFHDFITEDKEEYYYDYAILEILKDEEGKESEMDMIAVAASKSMINHYVGLCKRAGLKLQIIAPHCLAIGRLFRYLAADELENDFAVLDLGAEETRVNIYHKGLYEVTRSIEMGTNRIAQVVADELHCDPHIAQIYMKDNKNHVLESQNVIDCYSEIAIDIMRAINYYTFENRDNTLEKLYYHGGGSNIRPLIDEIANTIQLEVHPLSELAIPSIDDAAALLNGPASIGICLQD